MEETYRSIHRILRLSSSVMVISGFWALATSEAFDISLVGLGILIVLCAPIGEYLDRSMQFYRYLTGAITLVMAGMLPMLWAASGSLVLVVTILVIYIIAHKLIHAKETKDYYQLYLMAFFLLLAAVPQSPEAGFAVALAVFVMSAVWSFLMLQVRSEALANRGNAFADIIPLDQREPVVPGQAQTFLNGGLIASLAGLSFIALSITAAFFIFTPRTDAGLFGRNDSRQSTTGVDKEVNLNDGGRITEDPSPVMRVRFPDEPGAQFAGEKYWRMVSLEEYHNGSWTRGDRFQRRTRDRLRRIDFLKTANTTIVRSDLPNVEGVNSRNVRQEIFFDDSQSDVLPALNLVKRVTAPNAVLDWDSRYDMTVVVMRKKAPSLSYEAVSEVRDIPPELLRDARTDYIEALGRNTYETWTDHNLRLETQELARAVIGDATTVYDQVVATNQFLSGSDFIYTLNVPDMGNERPIEQFIHNYRRGHCEMFASAMALMLRSQGIPARVVQGYRGGEWYEADQSYIVRKSMAHLWVEVYFIDYGWVIFDPAAGQSESDELAVWWLSRWWSDTMIRARMRWYTDVVNFQGGLRVRQLRTVAHGLARFDFDPLIDTVGAWGRVGQGVMGTILVSTILGLVFAFIVGSAVRFLRRLPQMKDDLTPDQRQATRLYRTLRVRLSKMGTDCAGMTSSEVAQAARERGDLDTELVDRVISLYDRVRFGAWEIDPGQMADLQKRVKGLRSETV